ncbi:MAG: hypothetical protein AAFY57_07335 [Cyanobacteria bacterium J06642_2]
MQLHDCGRVSAAQPSASAQTRISIALERDRLKKRQLVLQSRAAKRVC